MMFRLTYNGGDVQCPHCQKGFAVEWDTEYGDSLVGEHETECLECNKSFNFSVYHQYSSY